MIRLDYDVSGKHKNQVHPQRRIKMYWWTMAAFFAAGVMSGIEGGAQMLVNMVSSPEGGGGGW